MDFREEYKQKLVSADEAVKLIKSGDWVDYGWCTNTVDALDQALAKRTDELTDVKLRGGWRIGIRSFDGKRYYYYAHLRKDYPYQSNLKEGSLVTAGDVIGYLGHTGYSSTENTNNIAEPHLHFGLQLIFDESQKEGNNEIWIDCYELIRFLAINRSETVKKEGTKEWTRVYEMKDPSIDQFSTP